MEAELRQAEANLPKSAAELENARREAARYEELVRQGLSATIIPSAVLPMSIIGTFAVMYLLDYSIDNLSLMALTLAVGFVVDDAIVVLENIARHVEHGTDRMTAALRGARESRSRLFETSERWFTRMRSVYERTLDWSLRHRRHVLASFVASLLLTAALLVVVPKGFIPSPDTGQVFGKDLDFYGFIGVIMLIGIVKKNAIMMIDFALGYGAGGEVRQTRGLAVVGGLLVSQLLTLYIAPVLYLYLEDLRARVARRRVARSAPAPAAGGGGGA